MVEVVEPDRRALEWLLQVDVPAQKVAARRVEEQEHSVLYASPSERQDSLLLDHVVKGPVALRNSQPFAVRTSGALPHHPGRHEEHLLLVRIADRDDRSGRQDPALPYLPEDDGLAGAKAAHASPTTRG